VFSLYVIKDATDGRDRNSLQILREIGFSERDWNGL
jgi:hypothetical protein